MFRRDTMSQWAGVDARVEDLHGLLPRARNSRGGQRRRGVLADGELRRRGDCIRERIESAPAGRARASHRRGACSDRTHSAGISASSARASASALAGIAGAAIVQGRVALAVGPVPLHEFADPFRLRVALIHLELCLEVATPRIACRTP